MTKAGKYVSSTKLHCPCCDRDLPSNSFRGRRFKTAICQECEARHPGKHWCVDCSDWLSEDAFYRVGVEQAFMTNRCKPCKVFNNHGVTRAHMVELTGRERPACGSCGFSGARLSIDHDHRHCPGELGCIHCVRGYLCQQCNTAEGLLRTVERAKALADYMERTQLSEADLSNLPPSQRVGTKRDRRVVGAGRVYYDHGA